MAFVGVALGPPSSCRHHSSIIVYYSPPSCLLLSPPSSPSSPSYRGIMSSSSSRSPFSSATVAGYRTIHPSFCRVMTVRSYTPSRFQVDQQSKPITHAPFHIHSFPRLIVLPSFRHISCSHWTVLFLYFSYPFLHFTPCFSR